ncbi:MAG: SpvB/TcaC N-terminal domain-containing protein [Terrimicrobiaceae bacterium]
MAANKQVSEEHGVRPPAIALPKGGGAIRGIGEKFAANPVTGTGSMTVPIATSPGRSGFGPQLSLSYDSGAGNGEFGFGWNLSLPSITRKTDKGLPRYLDAEESDVYILSGAEDLVPVLQPNGSRFEDKTSAPGYTIHRYRPRIEGLFARIERWTNQATREIHWRSISRDNITTLYGKTPESRVSDSADPAKIFSWLICQSYDDKGNAIVYEYRAENSDGVDLTQAHERNRTQQSRSTNRYLKRIRYGNRKPNRDVDWKASDPSLLPETTWMFEVVFDYDEGHYEALPLDPTRPELDQHRRVLASAWAGRGWSAGPDPFSTYRPGFEVRIYRRCRRVLMFHRFAELGSELALVRSTEFEYADLDYAQPITIETELAHQGSTRFASFIRSVTQSGFARDESQPVLDRNGINYVTYLKKSLPPVEYEYSKASIQDEIRELDAGSLENLPIGLDGGAYEWLDLDGEGVSGILTEQADAWFYKPNLGEGRFGSLHMVPAKASLAALGSGRQQLLDLAGDGQLDLVTFAGPTPGFYERTLDEDWEPFREFTRLPNLPWDEPNLRFIDLNGDGHADVLITEDEAIRWYPSEAEEGFGAATQVRTPPDEEKGPRLLFADGTQSIYLADMCGDGLTDLVRIREGEVCYWPNLGYGRFGAKVTMDNAPRFDGVDQFSQQRVRLADIDGSGTNDIIYVGRDGVRLFFNQSGNRWNECGGVLPRSARSNPHLVPYRCSSRPRPCFRFLCRTRGRRGPRRVLPRTRSDRCASETAPAR